MIRSLESVLGPLERVVVGESVILCFGSGFVRDAHYQRMLFCSTNKTIFMIESMSGEHIRHMGKQRHEKKQSRIHVSDRFIPVKSLEASNE